MGLLGCECPDGELTTITSDGCKPYRGAGKIAKIIFQKVENSNAFVNNTNGIDLAASWATLPDASDSTKVVITPFLSTVELEEVETVDGAENFDGAVTKTGVRPQRVVATITDPKPEVVQAIDSIACNSNAGVYFVWSSDKITGNKVADTPETFLPIKISPETYIGKTPTRSAEFGAQFIYSFEFQIPADYYKDSGISEPEDGFSYLTDISPTPTP